jgi:hypothetical protein
VTWFKVDDSFHSHPKIAATSLAALGLWAVAGTWSGDHLTDGFVPDHMIPLLSRGANELVTELVERGLWSRTKGGYRYHDWAVYQPTRERVERERKAAAARQARRRETLSRRDSRGSHRGSNAVTHTTPTRPPPKGGGSPVKSGEGSAVLPKPHPFVDEGNPWCAKCELPRVNKVHTR